MVNWPGAQALPPCGHIPRWHERKGQGQWRFFGIYKVKIASFSIVNVLGSVGYGFCHVERGFEGPPCTLRGLALQHRDVTYRQAVRLNR